MAQVLDTAISSTHRVRDVRQSMQVLIGMKTPVSSRIPKAPKPQSSTPEWPIKTYADANTDGVIEGAALTAAGDENNLANKTMLLGRFQRKLRQPAASKEAVLLAKQYGVATDVFQDNVKDKTIELHRDIESTILSDNESVVPVAGTTASKTRGIPRWLSKDNSRFTDTATTPADAYRTPATSILVSKAAASDITEDEVRSVIKSVADARKEEAGEFWGVCTTAMRDAFSNYTRTDLNGSDASSFPVRRFNQQLGDTMTLSVTGYKSELGRVDLMTSFLLPASVHFLFLDMDALEIGHSQAPQFLELPFDGATRRGMIDALFVMEVLNPQAHGKAITGATA